MKTTNTTNKYIYINTDDGNKQKIQTKQTTIQSA